MMYLKVLAPAGAAVLLIVAGVLGYLSGRDGAQESLPAPVTVAVTRGDVSKTVVAPGQVVGTRELLVGMNASGRLAEISVRPGSVVRPCHELARLETGPLEEAVEIATLERRSRFLDGFSPLLSREVERAEAELASASLTAPFEAVVVEIMATPGETVAKGQPVVLISDPSQVEVRATVIEEDLPLVSPGQPVELFFDAQPADPVEGRIVRIVPQRVRGENRPLYHVYISVGRPPDGVLPGMTADASITVDRRPGVLRLPRSVIRAAPAGKAVVKVWAEGRKEERTVAVGLRGDVNVEIVDGLTEGDMVVAE